MIKLLLCFAVLLTASDGCRRAAKADSPVIVFDGIVERIAEGIVIRSGDIASYHLVKYRVERVCEGEYDGKEIVVDHLILTGEELKGLKVGDRVCVAVRKSDKVLTRFNAEGIRDPSEAVTTFYIGGKVEPAGEDAACKCSASK